MDHQSHLGSSEKRRKLADGTSILENEAAPEQPGEVGVIEVEWQEIHEPQPLNVEEDVKADPQPWGAEETPPYRKLTSTPWRPPTIKPEEFYREVDDKWRIEHQKRLENGAQLVITTQKRSLPHVFHKQDLAFAFADEANAAVYPPQPRHCPVWRVFAFERRTIHEDPSLQKGTRSYVAASLKEFWEVYQHIAANSRNFYEVIRQGMPSKLYFDLEYNQPANPTLDGNQVMKFFVEKLIEYVASTLGRMLTQDDIIELDSTTETKFSKHLIVPSIVFDTNIIAGHFARQFVTSMYQKFVVATTPRSTSTDSVISESEYSLCFPVSEAGSRTALVDLGVYTKNRNFRIYGSSKLSKNTPLKLSQECKYDYGGDEEKLFLDSLVSNVPSKYEQTQVVGVPESQAASTGSSHDHEYYNALASSTGDAISPFPELDEFVKKQVLARPGNRGYIRGWMLYESASLLTYQIGGNRYCERIKREHKSNHIAIVVDLNTCVWHQRCLDPECRAGSYKSESRPIPPQIICPLIGDSILDLEVDVALRAAETNGTMLPDHILASLDLP